jgi:glucose-6-phosphate 1-epimerase
MPEPPQNNPAPGKSTTLLEPAMQKSVTDTRHTEQIEAHGIPALRLRASGSEALVFLHGAQVAAFSTAEHGELLWLSRQSQYALGKPIRGGIPICFPWFGPHPSDRRLPSHGFARTLPFRFIGSEASGDNVTAELELASDAATLALFPHVFVARLRVSVGRELSVAFEVENTGTSAFDYELALHTYLGVSDVRGVQAEGLAGASYHDKVSGQRAQVQAREPLCFTGETDRVYDSAARVTVRDAARKRRLIIDKTNSATTVIWNPWVDKARSMSDFGDDEWPSMLCVEAANAGARRILLPPQARHVTTTIISAETSASD